MNLPINRSWLGRLRRPVLLLVAAGAAVLPISCGKKGPLYVPDEAREQMKAGDHAATPVPPPPEK
jgi:predicted small lipoprotein YifL